MLKIKTILMLKTEKGSPNGIALNTYEKGETYDLPEELANTFIKIKVAKASKREEKKVVKPKGDKAKPTETPEGKADKPETPETPKKPKK